MSYLNDLLTPQKSKLIVEQCSPVIERLKPTVLVGTGVSGIISCSILSHATGIPMAVARKPDDSYGHSNLPIEHSRRYTFPSLFERWLLVDDFVAQGGTFRRVYKAVQEELSQHVLNSCGCKCLGVLSTVEYGGCAAVVQLGESNRSPRFVVFRDHLPIWSHMKRCEFDIAEAFEKEAIDMASKERLQCNAQDTSTDREECSLKGTYFVQVEGLSSSASPVACIDSDPSRESLSSSVSKETNTET